MVEVLGLSLLSLASVAAIVIAGRQPNSAPVPTKDEALDRY